MSAKKTSEYFSMLNAGERFIVVATVFMSVVTIASFICSLTAYLITHKSQNIIDNAMNYYVNGTLYSNDDCFTCTSTGCGLNVPPNSPCMTIKEQIQMKDSHTQQFGRTSATTIGNIAFPPSQKQGGAVGTFQWFADHIRILPGTNVYIKESFVGNMINSLQIGTFDYINNKTTVCNKVSAFDGSVYYAVDPSNTDNKYLCICVYIPPLFNTFGESCAQFV